MERRKQVRSRLSLITAVALTGTLFYSMLTWTSASAADNHVDAKLNGTCTNDANPCFSPKAVTVAPLDTVTWENKDTALSHEIEANSPFPAGAFEGTCAIGPGETCTKDINPIPTAYGYHCNIHPEMTGQIIVDPEGGGGPSESASGSPSSSASASSSPSTSPSGSPSASTSPSASPSASSSPSPPPGPVEIDRTVSLDLKKHLKAKGRVVGDVPEGACINDVKVTIQKRKKRKGWKKVDSTRTGVDGKYSVGIPDREGKYRAKIGVQTFDNITCGADKSPTESHKHANGRRR